MPNSLSYVVVCVCGLAVGGKSIPPHTTENVTKPTPSFATRYIVLHYRLNWLLDWAAQPKEIDGYVAALCVCVFVRLWPILCLHGNEMICESRAKREESLLLLPPSSPPRPDKNGSLFQAHPLKVSMKLHVAKGVLFPPPVTGLGWRHNLCKSPPGTI